MQGCSAQIVPMACTILQNGETSTIVVAQLKSFVSSSRNNVTNIQGIFFLC